MHVDGSVFKLRELYKFKMGFVHFQLGQNSIMESVYIPGTRQERVGIEKPSIDLFDLSKKIQYHVTRKEFEIANDLLKDFPSDRSQEMKKMFGLD